MSSEFGSMAGAALETLGTTFSESYGRDAIHLATIAVTSSERLYGGQHVGLLPDQTVSAKAPKLIGIVDPFLQMTVVGERFWLVLYPRTITSLRHVWTHPEFDEEKIEDKINKKLQSELWMQDFCRNTDAPPYHDLIAVAARRADNIISDWEGEGEGLCFGIECSGEIPPEFWTHIENIIGRPIKGPKAAYFRCAC